MAVTRQGSPRYPRLSLCCSLHFWCSCSSTENERQGHPIRNLQHRILNAETCRISRPSSGPDIMKPLPLPRAISVSFESDDEPLQKLREGLRKMPDQNLIAFGKAARSLCSYGIAPRRSSGSWMKRERNSSGGMQKHKIGWSYYAIRRAAG